MERIIGFFGLFIGSVGHAFRNGLTSPNIDSDTGLDHHPMPSQSELDAAAKKYNYFRGAEEWSPLPLPNL